jgi:hypothetical protein
MSAGTTTAPTTGHGRAAPLDRLRSVADRVLWAPRPAWTAALVRILLGLVLLAWALTLLGDLDAFFSPDGLSPVAARDRFGWSGFFVPDTLSEARTAVLVLAGAAVAILVGWRPRLWALVAFGLMVALQKRSPVIINSGDLALRDLVLLLALTPCGAAMSVDRWLRHGRAALATAPEVAPWGMRPLQLQVVTVYVFAFWTKSGDLWANGTAVSTVLRVDDLQRLSVPDWVVSNVLLIAALTWGALAIEFALGFGLWFRRARHPLIVCGILLHGSIGAFLLVGFFGPTMVAGLCAFVAPATARRLLLAPTRALWAPRGVGTPAALPPAPR